MDVPYFHDRFKSLYKDSGVLFVLKRVFVSFSVSFSLRFVFNRFSERF